MNYLNMCIKKDISIKTAMKKLDESDNKILFIVEENKLLATLTDGDIRRYLIAGGDLGDCAYKAANCNPLSALSIDKARRLYDRKDYIAIPIINDKGELTDIYLGEDSLYHKIYRLKVPVVVNAGGRGTRLDPFTKVLPKPLIPVGDLPIIEHIMREYEKYGCYDFHIIVNYKKQLVKAYFKESEHKYNIKWHDEEVALGTGGGLCFLKGQIHETFFFTNCDILLKSNYDSMIRYHKESGNAITMVCAYKNITIPYGVIEMGENASIENMKEKPELSFLTNTGMYIVEPEVLDDIEDNVPIGFPDIIKLQKEKGRKVSVYPVSENEWMDMGQLSELEKMRIRLYGE